MIKTLFTFFLMTFAFSNTSLGGSKLLDLLTHRSDTQTKAVPLKGIFGKVKNFCTTMRPLCKNVLMQTVGRIGIPESIIDRVLDLWLTSSQSASLTASSESNEQQYYQLNRNLDDQCYDESRMGKLSILCKIRR